MSDFMLLVMKVRWIHAFCKGMSKYKKQFTIILVTDQVICISLRNHQICKKRRNHQTNFNEKAYSTSLKKRIFRLSDLILVNCSRSVTNLRNKLFKVIAVVQLQQHQTMPHIILLLQCANVRYPNR